MKKSFFILAVVVFLLVVLVNGVSVYSSKAGVKINLNGEVDYIINGDNINKLDEGKYNVLINSNEEKEIEKDKIKREFEYTDYVSAELNKEDIEYLVSKGIEVRLERNFSVALSDVVKIINASKSWQVQINGKNLTGINQTVCIIDTGVNYTRSALGGCYGNNNPNSGCKVIGGHDFYNDDNNPVDDHGHGTHVAGIVAANGSINGVAPEAKIIAIKALGSSGSGTDSMIISGIEWCITNSSLFNISVISMSLGDTINYTGYCNDDSLASSINTAVGMNISVVVASGNSGNYTSLSSPACVQNATPIGATNKDDSVASYSNRNSLLKVLAPGTNIVSTCLGEGSCISSGTSMATPAAAGAIAIINEFLDSINVEKSPEEIENSLNNSGFVVYDSLSMINYSRINVYDSLNSLSFNYINLVSPNNGVIINSNQTFLCNSSSSLSLVNSTFFLWNSTSLEYNSTLSLSGFNNRSSFNYSFTRSDTYSWTCLFVNNLGFAKNTGNYSITYDSQGPAITAVFPLNNSWTNGEFNLTLDENGTCLYSLNNGRNNISMSTNNQRNFFTLNQSILQNSPGNVTYYCNDSFGNMNSSENIFFNADYTLPNVTLISPSSGFSETGETTLSFKYNVSDNLNMSSCGLILNGIIVSWNSSAVLLGNETNTISRSVSEGSYSWGINCTDIAGNTGNSSLRGFTINSASVSSGGSSGGGGGGGAGGTTYIVPKEEISGGYTKELEKDDSIKFSLFDSQSNEHTLTLDYLGGYFINITIRSSPIKLVLAIGQSAKINLTSNDYYDLYIKLENIESRKAKLTIQTIYEPISSNVVSAEENEDRNETTKEYIAVNKNKANFKVNVLILIIIFILIGLFARFFYLRSKKEFKKEIESDIVRKIEKDLKKRIKK